MLVARMVAQSWQSQHQTLSCIALGGGRYRCWLKRILKHSTASWAPPFLLALCPQLHAAVESKTLTVQVEPAADV